MRNLVVPPKTWNIPRCTDPNEKRWTCLHCGVMEPIEFRGSYVRRRCDCERRADEEQRKEMMRKSLAQAKLAHAYSWLGRDWAEASSQLTQKTFTTFQNTLQQEAFETVRSFALRPQGVLTLYGNFGTGKTHLLVALINERCGQGHTCLFASAVTLFDALQERIRRQNGYQDLLKQALTTGLLVLDDLDKLKPSEFREEILYKLINGRTTAGKPLALSCNCTPDELERWVGKAARSRLMQGMIPVPMEGLDYRSLSQTSTHQ